MNKFNFGNRSDKNLVGVHPHLVRLCVTVLSLGIFDFGITCGKRDKEGQDKAVFEGRSKVKYPNSKHNKEPAEAVSRDFPPLPAGATWTGRWDHKLDGEVVTNSFWELRLDIRNGNITGHVLKISDGNSSDSILSGQVIKPTVPTVKGKRGVSVLVLRHDTSANGYFVINTACRVSASRFLGTWIDSLGQTGDFELTLTDKNNQ